MNHATFDRSILYDRLVAYPGAYECHITVDIDEGQTAAFTVLCEAEQADAVVITLAQGRSRHQPMLGKQLRDTPSNVLAEIERLYASLASRYNILRVKVEADVANANIPLTQSVASDLPLDCYFEHHVKIECETVADIEPLRQQVKACGGHLSQNALSTAGATSRFVTQRCYKAGNDGATQQLNGLLDLLAQQPCHIRKIIREFNIFDSRIALDAGWMTDV